MPDVLGVFKIIIDYIWSILTIKIPLGNGVTITFWMIDSFVILAVVLIKFITQDNTFGGDRAESFSTSRRRGKRDKFR